MMAQFEITQVSHYRLLCRAAWVSDEHGCSGSGPIGYSKSEARELAEEHGWRLIEGEGVWACPAHARAKEAALTTETMKGDPK